MNQEKLFKGVCVRVSTRHQLDYVVGRVRALGGVYEHWNYDTHDTMYDQFSTYNNTPVAYDGCYLWVVYFRSINKIMVQMHNHNCNVPVFSTWADALAYLEE